MDSWALVQCIRRELRHSLGDKVGEAVVEARGTW